MAELRFEEQMQRLQEIVSKLESGEVDMDESLALYEEGLKLSKALSMKLQEYDARIAEITKENTHE